MDIQKEREAFEKLLEIKKRLDMKCVHFNGTWYATNPHMGNSFATASYLNGAWSAWQAAKAQAVPENKKFNLDEFLIMEEKLKSKGGVIAADLDRFIAYAEMVLEKAKALKEPK